MNDNVYQKGAKRMQNPFVKQNEPDLLINPAFTVDDPNVSYFDVVADAVGYIRTLESHHRVVVIGHWAIVNMVAATRTQAICRALDRRYVDALPEWQPTTVVVVEPLKFSDNEKAALGVALEKWKMREEMGGLPIHLNAEEGLQDIIECYGAEEVDRAIDKRRTKGTNPKEINK